MLFLVILALGACSEGGGGREPFTDTRLPPGLSPRFWPPEGWAWGLLQISGKPALRYGVAAPRGASIGHVIILPSYGETAEGWFETTRALIDRGYTVWILEAAGQGGSGRYVAARRHGHAPDFEADIVALPALDRIIVRPGKAEPVTILASGLSDLVALAALERGYRPTRLILSDPQGSIPDRRPWKRQDASANRTARRRASDSWSLANPDLRIGGPSRGWVRAREKLQAEVMASSFAKVTSPVQVISPVSSRFPCAGLPRCRETIIPANEAYPFAPDAARDLWLGAVFQSLAWDEAR